MLRRAATVAALMLSLAVTMPALAFADDWWSDVDCATDPAACDLEVGTPGDDGDWSGSDGNSSGGQNWLAGCTFELAGSSAHGEHEGQMGTWYYVQCPGQPRPQFPIFFPDDEPVLSPAEVAQMARRRLRLPTPTIAANPAGDQLVNLPTWLWLSSGWAPASATAAVPGVSVTAVARPTSVTWSMGDGGAVTCSGPGTPFPAGGDPRNASPDCGYTYRTSSAGQRGEAFSVSATVNWTVTWSGAGQSGVFPNMTTSASVAFRVAESHGIATG
jgi:hypothetical protein